MKSKDVHYVKMHLSITIYGFDLVLAVFIYFLTNIDLVGLGFDGQSAVLQLHGNPIQNTSLPGKIHWIYQRDCSSQMATHSMFLLHVF